AIRGVEPRGGAQRHGPEPVSAPSPDAFGARRRVAADGLGLPAGWCVRGQAGWPRTMSTWWSTGPWAPSVSRLTCQSAAETRALARNSRALLTASPRRSAAAADLAAAWPFAPAAPARSRPSTATSAVIAADRVHPVPCVFGGFTRRGVTSLRRHS